MKLGKIIAKIVSSIYGLAIIALVIYGAMVIYGLACILSIKIAHGFMEIFS